ncbi:DNA-binding response regulator [Dactylosporangium sp. McL0621]|uniref:DNA-binding response regulator n=1 Tax=Dactylosporangium sp. McL0621 TaxID=3415678 RepID=UPI003CF5C71D
MVTDDRLVLALVVDDDPFVRRALTLYLKQAGYDVAEAGNGQAAVELVKSLRPGVIIMDVMMPPGISGIEATRHIVEWDPSARVVMFSVHQTDDVVSAAVAAGATSYVTKETPLPTLLDAIARTVDGQSVLIPAPKAPARPLPGSALSPRAQDILNMTVEGLTARQIGERLTLSPRTVEGHLRDVYAQLGVTSRAQLVQVAVTGNLVSGGSAVGGVVESLTLGWKNLTERERAVAMLAGRALTNQQIARRLGISMHTVNFHLRQIFRKLSVSSRVDLSRIAEQAAEQAPE